MARSSPHCHSAPPEPEIRDRREEAWPPPESAAYFGLAFLGLCSLLDIVREPLLQS